jgi:uncharacterized protein YjeT (DUF2065 family)
MQVNQGWHLSRWGMMHVQKLKRLPSATALGIQLFSLLVVVWLSGPIYQHLIGHVALDIDFLIFSLVALQSVLSATLSICIGMAVWWRWIHAVFPFAVWLMMTCNIPSSIYLAGFLLTLTLYWTTFKTQVPFYPSRPAVWKSLLQIVQQQSPQQTLRMIDIGSGLGDLSMFIANARPHDRVEGIEIAPLPWMISRVRSMLKQSQAQFVLGNYQHLDFSHYDIVFAYLSPAAMPQLWQKACAEMREGCLLISLEFDIPDTSIAPQIVVTGPNTPPLHIWRIAR